MDNNGTTSNNNSTQAVDFEQLHTVAEQMRLDFLVQAKAITSLFCVVTAVSPLCKDNQIIVLVSQKTYDELRK